jgi:hypothetical protein
VLLHVLLDDLEHLLLSLGERHGGLQSNGCSYAGWHIERVFATPIAPGRRTGAPSAPGFG